MNGSIAVVGSSKCPHEVKTSIKQKNLLLNLPLIKNFFLKFSHFFTILNDLDTYFVGSRAWSNWCDSCHQKRRLYVQSETTEARIQEDKDTCDLHGREQIQGHLASVQ